MQWTLGLIFTLMASFAGCAAVTGGAVWENKWRKTGPDGVILTDGVLFDVAARSKLECARLCAETSECVTFTSAQTGAAVSCRGHSSSVTLGSLVSAVQWERVIHRTDSTLNVPLNLLTTSGGLTTAVKTTAGDADLTTAAMTTAGDADLTTAAMTTAGVADLTTAAMTTAGEADLTTVAVTTAGDADLTTVAVTTAGDADLTTAAMTTAGDADLTTAAMTTAGDADLTTAAMTTAGDADLTTTAVTTAGDADLTTAAMTTAGDADLTAAAMTTAGDADLTTAAMTTAGAADFTTAAMTTVGDTDLTTVAMSTAGADLTTAATTTAGPVEVPVIGSACNDDSDCVTSAGFECFVSSGQCLCIAGYYFSEDSNACVTTCIDLLDTFMMYPDSGMAGANIKSFLGKTREQCQVECINRADCLTVEFHPNFPAWLRTTTCNLQDVTPLTNPGDWNSGTDVGWDMYQKRCA